MQLRPGIGFVETSAARPARPAVFRPAQVVQRAADDEARYRMNHQKIRAALDRLYQMFYEHGRRRAVKPSDVSGYVYGALGYEESTYLAKPLASLGGLAVQDDGDYLVRKQGADKSVSEADLNKGNYYHVHNRHYVKPESRQGLARRIVANVASQQDTMLVFNRLVAFFKSGDPAVLHIREFKVYVGNSGKTRVKKDKLVVYYDYVAGAGGADVVGDAIVAVVQSAGATFGEDLAPFYSVVASGIAWAEEPKFHSRGATMQGSFTRTRATVITAVINANELIANAGQFLELVAAAFRCEGIDLARAHRHG